MTRQAPHTLMYEGHEYELLGDSTGQLPRFDLLGVSPKGSSTAGSFWPKYEIANSRLYLASITMWYGYENDDELEKLPVINGIKVTGAKFFIAYDNINFLMPQMGYILIGRELASDLWVRRGLTDYTIVLRLALKHGEVEAVEDVSNQVAIIRTKQDEIDKEAPRDYLAWRDYRADERKELDKQLDELTGGKRRRR
jgi:hypothetical protein